MAVDSEWEQLYQQAMLELDDAVLVDRITTAEYAVRKRLVEVRCTTVATNQFEEQHRLEDALYSLQSLRRISPGRSK